MSTSLDYEVVPLNMLDVSQSNYDIVIELSLFFKEQLSFEKLESSWATLIQAWPILSARIRKDSSSPNGLVYHIPTIHGLASIRRRELDRDPKKRQFYCLDEGHRSVSTFSSSLAHSNEAMPSMEIFTAPGPDKAEHERIITANSTKSTKEYLNSDCPLMSVQVTRFNDGTLVSISTSHVIGDGFAIKATIAAWQDILNGKGPPAPMQDLGMDPFLSLSPEHLPEEENDSPVPRGNALYNFRQKSRLIFNYFYDLFISRPESKMQQRYIFIPRHEVERLQAQVQQDLEQKGSEEKIATEKVSKFNTLFAWTMQNSHAGLTSFQTTTPLAICNVKRDKPTGIDMYPRHDFWGGAYTVAIKSLPVKTLVKMPLGELALHFSKSMQEHSNEDSSREALKFWLRHGASWNKPSKGFPFFGSPSDHFTGITDWKGMQWFDVDFGGAVNEGKGNRSSLACNVLADMTYPMSKRDRWVVIGESDQGIWMVGGVTIDQWRHRRGFGRYQERLLGNASKTTMVKSKL